mmetsp:Transcript_137502/g.439349  ORF Transcript_137502/g.439349 Transcript_137502/m.439349 type:complete len:227 (+) Transcript_137502:331-1011(+)
MGPQRGTSTCATSFDKSRCMLGSPAEPFKNAWWTASSTTSQAKGPPSNGRWREADASNEGLCCSPPARGRNGSRGAAPPFASAASSFAVWLPSGSRAGARAHKALLHSPSSAFRVFLGRGTGTVIGVRCGLVFQKRPASPRNVATLPSACAPTGTTEAPKCSSRVRAAAPKAAGLPAADALLPDEPPLVSSRNSSTKPPGECGTKTSKCEDAVAPRASLEARASVW